MNGLVNKTPFFLILSGIFAFTVLVALSIDSGAPPPAGVPVQGLDKAWEAFSHVRGAASTGFVAIGAFLWLFSAVLWRLKWFYPWLITQRDITRWRD